MALTWPIDCTTPSQRTEYCYCAQEKLRVIHNKMGKWYTDGGVTETQYNSLLPQKIKDRYAYTPQLSQADWDDFRDNVFEPINAKITNKLLEQRELLKTSAEWTIAVEDI